MGLPLLFSFAVSLAFLLHRQAPSIAGDSSPSDILTDKEALISFRSSIAADPSNTLSSWDQNSSPCNWTGVICNNSRQRVVGLDLAGLGMTGTITPYLGNLSFLTSIHLQNNQLSGTLPDRIGGLSRLLVLNMSSNLIEGPIPPNISRCKELTVLDLMGNHLSGEIPARLDQLSKLQVLDLSHNRLSGAIPPSIGNLSSLTTLNLITNFITGLIPHELGTLQNLKMLDLTLNNLTGTVSPSLYNISSLVHFALAANNLWGEIPSDIGDKLPNLLFINFCMNKFTGRIPGSLHNLTKIETIRLSWNFLDGPVPPGLQNLRNIEMYQVGYNWLVSSGDDGLNFITALSNSSRLELLAFGGNLLEGKIPESIGNLSNTLRNLYMGGNRIYGNIPPSIRYLSNLSLLNLSHNLISGEVPTEIGQLKELQVLCLAGNKLSGKIPDSLGDLRNLTKLELSGNELVGRIPTTFGNYQRLLSMDLSNNRLNGSIPKDFFRISSLSYFLNLSKNSLSGPLPQEIGLLENLVTIDLSENRLSGSIPDSIGNCRSLEYLFMARNSFSGQIPRTLGQLWGLNTLDLSSNQLSGPIPPDIKQLQVLHFLNLSFNNLKGEVPTDGVFRNRSSIHLEGNPKLCFPSACENSQGHGRRSSVARIIIPIASSIALCLVLGLLLLILSYRRSTTTTMTTPETPETPVKGQYQMVSYDELRVATGNFDQANLIGSGSFGAVYRGILRQGTVVGVKVINHGTNGALKSFFAECKVLRNVRHRNLVKLITSCSSIDFNNVEFQALVYEFMENGNLGDWLHGKRRHEGGEGMNFVERLNVAIDVASAMDYLHHGCQPPVVHCDLKPRNVLLDVDMNAKVGDFGLARLMAERESQETSSTTTCGLKGSVGYIPPEYGLGGKASTRGDVYSFGVVLLELFTGKSPTHEMFMGELSLAKWVQSAIPGNIREILDPELLHQMDYFCPAGYHISPTIQQKSLESMLDVALSCAIDSPQLRINMRVALHALKDIRDTVVRINETVQASPKSMEDSVEADTLVKFNESSWSVVF
uniref:non-specific serine/threonine protein kinase n=1 Tax=Nelumbo nucifera TaxID=4432 RepID=A0A822Y0R2_NELNU|nr:TPA_asm: hypothetical protein HUJ06_026300 [Nelumbo nucifera]